MEPFLKWPGGKRWLLGAKPQLFSREYARYVEPFVGGGAVFFSLEPARSILGDVNSDLISVYRAVRDGWNSIERRLAEHQELHCHSYYYAVRDDIPTCRFSRAARFIYLNRTCWNGLYRVNLRGQFNVPIGTKTSVVLGNDDFRRAATVLSGAELHHSDFEWTVARAGAGDLVFADPPYVAQENPATFRKYHTKSFTWDDQIRLRDALIAAVDRGAKVVVLNADTPSIRGLYRARFSLETLGARSTLAADSSRRGKRPELLAVSIG